MRLPADYLYVHGAVAANTRLEDAQQSLAF
jgi:hypothetical protein